MIHTTMFISMMIIGKLVEGNEIIHDPESIEPTNLKILNPVAIM